MNPLTSAFFPLRRFGLLWRWVGVLAAFISAAMPAHAQWISSSRVGDTAYFLFASPPRIERYDLAARSWMAAVELPSTYGIPTSGRVDADGMYVTYAKRSIYRYDLSDGSPTLGVNSALDVTGLLTDGSRLFINQSGPADVRFESINKSTGEVIDTLIEYETDSGASIAPTIRKIFGRTRGSSPSDITYLTYDATGKFLKSGDSPSHGDYPDATKTWVFPSETRVVDSSGTIYTTDTLQYAGSLGTKVDDIQFPADSGPVIVRGGLMTAYTNGLLPAGSVTLPFAPASFYLNAADAVIFGSDKTASNGIRVQAVPLSSLGTPVLTGEDPTNLAYIPDNVFVGNDGILLLVSKNHKSIFRWSPETQGYLSTIPLANAPRYSAYSKAANAVYLADEKGVVRSVDLDAATPVETPFAILPTEPLGLSVAGDYVFTADSSGAWCTHRTFNSAGTQVSAKDWNYYSAEYVWSDVSQKMYFFQDHISPNDLLSEQVDANGVLGEEAEGPLQKDETFIHPIRVSPDGGMVILGSGKIFNGATLAKLPIALPTAVKDIVWHGGKIKTIRTTVSRVAKLQSWGGPKLTLNVSRDIPGTGLRLFALDEVRMVAVCLSAKGRPLFQVVNGDFDVVPPSSLAAPAGLAITTPSAGRLLLEWSAVNGALGYEVRRKPAGSNKWKVLGRAENVSPRLEFDVIASDDTFDYQVVAINGDLVSPPSTALENVVSGPPLPPESFALKSITVDKAKFAWRDGTLENGYRLEIRKQGEPWKAAVFPAEDAVSASIGGFDSNSQYRFRIAARNPLGLSKWVYVDGATGEGQGEISVLFKDHARDLTDHEGLFEFGPATVGRMGPTSVRLIIRNVGKTELRDLSVKMTGSLAGDFKVSNLRAATIGSGKSAEIEIRFSPRGAGRRGAVLKIFSSDANESPFDIELAGQGVRSSLSGEETAPRSEASQHFNGFRVFARGAGGVEAGEAAAGGSATD